MLAAAGDTRNKRKIGRDARSKRDRENGEVVGDESKAFS